MKLFIEVPEEDGNVLINVNHIFMVAKEKEKEKVRISIAVNRHDGYPKAVYTNLPYEQVINLIEIALSE